uniref:heme oxygenase (biliverdin-producing) n=1 Tax=Eptatretus burgeri TaxID=7764 RepID=A0A8C4QR92_EPTBU
MQSFAEHSDDDLSFPSQSMPTMGTHGKSDELGRGAKEKSGSYSTPIADASELSEMLKFGTKESHSKAENTNFMKGFLRGELSMDEFKCVAVALYFIYAAMEEELDKNQDHPALAPLYFPTELHRKNAIEEDLAFLLGPEWRQHPKTRPSPATQRYVERLHAVGRTEPALLVAHAYTRYLGDLSGGQVLKKVVQRALKLPASGEGVEFFSFPQISSHAGFKQLYRSRLNVIDLDKEMRERIVEEANRAFNFNMEVSKGYILNKIDNNPNVKMSESFSNISSTVPRLIIR